jgi:hypothetical protein
LIARAISETLYESGAFRARKSSISPARMTDGDGFRGIAHDARACTDVDEIETPSLALKHPEGQRTDRCERGREG